MKVEDRDSLKEDDLADEAAGDVFALFWEITAIPVKRALSCFCE